MQKRFDASRVDGLGFRVRLFKVKGLESSLRSGVGGCRSV